jgi:hypothetical protein
MYVHLSVALPPADTYGVMNTTGPPHNPLSCLGFVELQVGQEETSLEVVKTVALFHGGNVLKPHGGKRPLVLGLGGPSGHGKTATAINIASLLAPDPLDNSNVVKISCASIRTHEELFGLAGPFQNAEKPSELNAFMRRNAGRLSVVRTHAPCPNPRLATLLVMLTSTSTQYH